jgi:hypothetical protein
LFSRRVVANHAAVRLNELENRKIEMEDLMKTFVVLTAAVAVASLTSAKADTIADWTFQTAASTNNIIGTGKTPGTTQSGISADIGLGTASASHASASTAWSIPAGNGSTNSWSANTWALGDYYQFTVSTVGYSGITISYDQTGSATGPGSFALQYSTDGQNFTTSGGNNTLLVSTWTPGTVANGFTFNYDLSSVSALNGDATAYFRVVDEAATTGGAINGGNVGTAGTDRIDNFIVSGVASAPEPSSIALGLVGGIAFLVAHRRKS